MTARSKKKDSEIFILTGLALLFTGFLAWMDINYSSIHEMGLVSQVLVWGGQIILAAIWVLVFGNWKDPGFDKWRYAAFIIVSILILWVGIHHATSKEDNQVLIDSKENVTK